MVKQLHSIPSAQPRVWLVRAGRQGEDEATALEEGLGILGFHEIPDLGQAKSPEAILAIVRSVLPEASDKRVRNFAAQLAAFVLHMRENDIVALPLKKRSQVALGRVTGEYRYREIDGAGRHTRTVRWLRTDVPRADFQQDLLYSLGAFMTVCQISRNQAERRIASILRGEKDPGPETTSPQRKSEAVESAPEAEKQAVDVAQIANDRILEYIATHFPRHEFARLVEAILQAEGFVTHRSEPGPDGGVDILAARGPLGFEGPHLCVQVKSGKSPEDVTTLRALQGSMQTFKASQGLLVSWSDFTRAVRREARQSYFNVRLWSASDVVEAIFRTYERFPEQIQVELPLRRIWTLVHEEDE